MDARVFHKLVSQFVRKDLAILKQKVIQEAGVALYDKNVSNLNFMWFEYWLACTYANNPCIVNKHYMPNQLYLCADRDRLLQLPWNIIVRNVPSGCWLSMYGVNGDTFLHLALGVNIRHHPDYAHYTKKMAHVYHSYKGNNYNRQPNGIHALLISLGYEGEFIWEILSAVQRCLEYEYDPKEFRQIIPLVTLLLKFYQEGLQDELAWEKICLLLEQKWKKQSKQLLRLNTIGKLTTAANRYFEEIEKQIQLEKLMQEHGYEADDEWAQSNVKAWNLRQQNGWYKIIELRSPSALVLEGARMHHCVGSYVEDCLERNTHIFSMRFRANGKSNWKSVATIAIEENNIYEMQGLVNTDVQEDHHEMIKSWATAENLTINLY